MNPVTAPLAVSMSDVELDEAIRVLDDERTRRGRRDWGVVWRFTGHYIHDIARNDPGWHYHRRARVR